MPDALIVQTLVAALKRGVDVQIIALGERIGAERLRRSSRAVRGDLPAAGAEIHEYQPTMQHCKVMIVDGLMISVGSTRFDNRTSSLNDEANLNIHDAAFARLQVEIFRGDLARARQLTLEQWRQRPWTEKLRQHAAALLRSQLWAVWGGKACPRRGHTSGRAMHQAAAAATTLLRPAVFAA